MHRRGQECFWRKAADASARLDERDLVKPADFFANAQTLIKFNEICAATQQKMLAIIQHLARAWMFIRGGAATNIRTSLKKRDLESHVSQSTACGKSGQPAADYRD